MKVRFQADADLNEILVSAASEAKEWINRIYSLPLQRHLA
jgi:hypothetical protein